LRGVHAPSLSKSRMSPATSVRRMKNGRAAPLPSRCLDAVLGHDAALTLTVQLIQSRITYTHSYRLVGSEGESEEGALCGAEQRRIEQLDPFRPRVAVICSGAPSFSSFSNSARTRLAALSAFPAPSQRVANGRSLRPIRKASSFCERPCCGLVAAQHSTREMLSFCIGRFSRSIGVAAARACP
jgi:hypothetical protein